MEYTYKLTTEEIDQLREIVQAHTPVGYLWYWMLTNELPIPDHAVEWDFELFDTLEDERWDGLALEAFRGSIKSTFIANAIGYTIGCMPELEHLIVQSGDDMAKENLGFISSMIEDQPGFKVMFPGIVPDLRKWGADGYEVVDTNLSYGTWRRKRTKVPTLVGGGYDAKIVLGKHPRGYGVRDDINDYKNTRSSRKLKACEDTVFKEISPAFDRTMLEIDVFTPWVDGDIGDKRKKLPGVKHILTPVYKIGPDGKLTNEPTWPEYFPESVIDKYRRILPPAEFAQMYLCDRSASSGQHLKREWLHFYPSGDIDQSWPVYIGVDYMSLSDVTQIQGRDWFVLAVGRLHPNGFMVIVDGYRAQITRAEAEDICLNWGQRYKEPADLLRVMQIEKLGKAEEFANWMLLNAPFRVKPAGVKNRSKAERFEVELAPVFRGGKVRVSDEPDNQFLDQFVREWLAWDGMENYPDDTLDAVWHCIDAAKTFIKPKKELEEEQQANPYMGFAA